MYKNIVHNSAEINILIDLFHFFFFFLKTHKRKHTGKSENYSLSPLFNIISTSSFFYFLNANSSMENILVFDDIFFIFFGAEFHGRIPTDQISQRNQRETN